jgi:hypothetical protein
VLLINYAVSRSIATRFESRDGLFCADSMDHHSTRVQAIRNQSAHDRRLRRHRPTLTPTPTKQTPSPLEQANFAKRPMLEQQLALNLAQFASEQNDIDLGRDKVTNLVGTLIVRVSFPVHSPTPFPWAIT